MTVTGNTGFSYIPKIWSSLSSLWNSPVQLSCTEKSERRQVGCFLTVVEKCKDGVELWPCDSRLILSHGGLTSLGIALVGLCGSCCNMGAALLLVASSVLKRLPGKNSKKMSKIISWPARLGLTDILPVAEKSSWFPLKIVLLLAKVNASQ